MYTANVASYTNTFLDAVVRAGPDALAMLRARLARLRRSTTRNACGAYG